MSDTLEHEARQFPRFDVYAMVSIPRGDEMLILEVKNISLGGLFVVADAATRDQFPAGTTHELSLVAAHEDGDESVPVTALVMRHEKTGVAFMITQRSDGLAPLIEQLKAK